MAGVPFSCFSIVTSLAIQFPGVPRSLASSSLASPPPSVHSCWCGVLSTSLAPPRSVCNSWGVGSPRVLSGLFHGAQLAVDTTTVSPLKRDGAPPSKCHCGRRCPGESEAKEGRHVSRIGRAIRTLPSGRVGLRSGRKVVRGVLGCVVGVVCWLAQRSESFRFLLERRVALRSDGPTPSSAEVEVDARYVSLSA